MVYLIDNLFFSERLSGKGTKIQSDDNFPDPVAGAFNDFMVVCRFSLHVGWLTNERVIAVL
jgi:hypothetical protein